MPYQPFFASPTIANTSDGGNSYTSFFGFDVAPNPNVKAARAAQQTAFQNERQQLQQQQAAKGIKNPSALINLQAQLHNKQITPQQFTQQFAKASQGAKGAAPTVAPFKVTPGVVASSALQAGKDIATGKAPAIKAIAKPTVDIATGQGGKLAHDTAQLSSDVTGGLVNQFAKAAVNVPAALGREVQNKPITDIQKNVFGTTNQGTIAKKILASTAGTGSLFVGGGEAAGLTKAATSSSKVAGFVGKLLAATKATAPLGASGAVGNAAQTELNNPNATAKQLAVSGAEGYGGAVALGGAAKGAGLVAKGIAKVGSQGRDVVNAGVGKAPAGVNDLIRNTKTNQLQQAGEQAAAKSNVGEQAVQGAKTQQIPVVSPTETNAARTSVGSTAVSNADRTSIPVAGKSTQVVGKSASIDTATYTKQSQQLSKAYDKEVAALKDHPPVVQKILQGHIDNKYQALQQNLDESAGKTSVSFNSKETTIPEPKANKAPSPAGVVAPKTTPTPVETGAGESVGRGSTPKTPEIPQQVTAPGSKVSGSALKSEQRAVQAGVVKDLGTKAEYATGSYKAEAAKAVDLAHNNPETAKAIAMGQQAGDNTIHEVAVRHAVEQKAISEGDTHTLLDLSKSTQHTATSQSAQRLGAEGYNTESHSPVAKITEVNNTRKAVFEKRTGTTINKATSSEVKAIRSATPKVSRETFASFVDSLKC